MSITYQFANSLNWQSLWSGNFSAIDVPAQPLEQFHPINPISIPVLVDSPIIAIYSSSSSAREHWKFAGTVFQKIQTGITVGGTPDSYVDLQKFYLNQITICQFLPLQSSFALEIKIPYWIRDINLQVWSYTGPIIDTNSQKLDLILSEVQN